MTTKRIISSMELSEIVLERRDSLSPAERRIAEAVLREPEHVAFGTLAEVAVRAGASGTSVLRLASKLGFEGFGALQTHIQDDLARRLRPARQRIRAMASSDTLSRALALEIDNLNSTFGGIDRGAFDAAAHHMAEFEGRVLVVASECVAGIGVAIADTLGALRDGVVLVEGNDVRLGKKLGVVTSHDVALVIDFRRYDTWVLRVLDIVTKPGAYVIALSDSPLSPLADAADAAFTVSAIGAGPFDSYAATLALAQALVAHAASFLASTAAGRLDSAESNWTTMQALTHE
jgi:DNA-binding MurR/RpiR family transcriptional regulator